MPVVIFIAIVAIFSIYWIVEALWPFLLVIAGIVALTWGAIWALRNYGPGSLERQRAEREAEREEELRIRAKITEGDKALIAVRRLDATRKEKPAEARIAWDRAQGQLKGRYSMSNAINSEIASKRLEYLKVVEPEPALEDFLPKQLQESLSREYATNYLNEARAGLRQEIAAHKAREKDRQKDIEETQRLRARLLGEEKQQRLEEQEELWPDHIELDPDIRGIEGIDNQVEAQNLRLETKFREFTNVLRAGLGCHPKGSGKSARGSQPLRRDPAYAPDQRIAHALEQLPLPVTYHPKVDVGYLEASQQALVEFQFPDVSLIPTLKGYRYTKTAKRINEVHRPVSDIKSTYAELISQVTLLAITFAFAADCDRQVETLVFNGYVDTVDPRSGHPIQPCLVSVRVTRDQFEKVNLQKVEAQACLRHLAASVSRSPSELAPVRPILDFEMFDPRFVSATDTISALDTRPNLMDLTPTEFEGLIQNLFEKMGLEARQTQASRDGGVDCIAYDKRPILGGKVVIQAKRYRNTVGVSAVRDLYGTLQNEGASKGILVTTSGYGAASFEFARNKPIELLEGSHLLYLLKEHAGVDAKIEAPEGWHDPVPD